MLTNQGKWSSGADPEMFLRKDGNYVAVQPYVIGTKEEPQPLPSGGNVQKDNVAIEFGIKPAYSKEEFVLNIGDTIHDLVEFLPDDVSLNVVASAIFPGNQLVHPECKMFGCNEDFNAWTAGTANPPPDTKANKRFRSAGGHIHIGYIPGSGYSFIVDPDGRIMFIMIMDSVVGIIATILDSGQPSIDRRKLYGKAGCFRPTDYGVEYRTLSNFWIKSPKLVELIYYLTSDALEIVKCHDAPDLIERLGPQIIQDVINSGDAKKATELFSNHIIHYLGFNSLILYNECLNVVDPYNFLDEWKNV